MIPDDEARELPAAGRVLDMAVFLSSIRKTTANKLAERYGVSRYTIYRYLDLLETIAQVPIERQNGKGIWIDNDSWYINKRYYKPKEIKAIMQSIDECKDKERQDILKGLL